MTKLFGEKGKEHDTRMAVDDAEVKRALVKQRMRSVGVELSDGSWRPRLGFGDFAHPETVLELLRGRGKGLEMRITVDDARVKQALVEERTRRVGKELTGESWRPRLGHLFPQPFDRLFWF